MGSVKATNARGTRPEPPPPTGATRHDRASWHPEDRAGILRANSLHVDQDQSQPLLLTAGLRGRNIYLVPHLCEEVPAIADDSGVIAEECGPASGAAWSIQAGVHHDALQPRGHCGLPAERVGPPERRKNASWTAWPPRPGDSSSAPAPPSCRRGACGTARRRPGCLLRSVAIRSWAASVVRSKGHPARADISARKHR